MADDTGFIIVSRENKAVPEELFIKLQNFIGQQRFYELRKGSANVGGQRIDGGLPCQEILQYNISVS